MRETATLLITETMSMILTVLAMEDRRLNTQEWQEPFHYRKGLSSQNQCHREMVTAERGAGADLQGPGANKRKHGCATFHAKALITQNNKMKGAEHRTRSPDVVTQ